MSNEVTKITPEVAVEQIKTHLGFVALYADILYQATSSRVKAELDLTFEDNIWSHKPILRIEEQSND